MQLPIRIELTNGRVQRLEGWCVSYRDGLIGLCRVSLPLADGNILEVSTGDVKVGKMDVIGQDIINGLQHVEVLQTIKRRER